MPKFSSSRSLMALSITVVVICVLIPSYTPILSYILRHLMASGLSVLNYVALLSHLSCGSSARKLFWNYLTAALDIFSVLPYEQHNTLLGIATCVAVLFLAAAYSSIKYIPSSPTKLTICGRNYSTSAYTSISLDSCLKQFDNVVNGYGE